MRLPSRTKKNCKSSPLYEILIRYLCEYFFCFQLSCALILFLVTQSPEYSQRPVSPAPPSDPLVNPFEPLQQNVPMKAINTELVPWLIAKEGFNFADRDNVETVTEMLTKVIIGKELNGYTAKTFAQSIEGKRVEQAKFSKHVLKTVGKRLFCSSRFLVSSHFCFLQQKLFSRIAMICAKI